MADFFRNDNSRRETSRRNPWRSSVWSDSFPTPFEVVGQVKWFDSTRGYGMIAQEGGNDVFVHISCLRESGYAEPSEGAAITCSVVEGPKGLQAVRVLDLKNMEINPLQRADAPGAEAGLFSGAEAGAKLEPVQVKWFNRENGYGFLESPQYDQDIYVPLRTLRAAGVEDLLSGQRIMARVVARQRGFIAIEIAPLQAGGTRREFFSRKPSLAKDDPHHEE